MMRKYLIKRDKNRRKVWRKRDVRAKKWDLERVSGTVLIALPLHSQKSGCAQA